MDLRTYPECVACQVTLTGLRFVLFSSISALLIMKPSVEITHGCLVRLEATQEAHLLFTTKTLRPLSPGPRRFEQCLAAREWGCLSGARECSQAGLPPVPHAGGCLHLLRPARGRSAPPRCGHANSRRQLHRPGTCDPPTCTHVVTSRWCRGTTVNSESKYGGDSFGGDSRTSKISCVGVDVWQRGSVGDAARSGTAQAAESHAISPKCRKLTRTWRRGAVKRFFVDLVLPLFQDNPVFSSM